MESALRSHKNFWQEGTLTIAKALHLDMTHAQKHYARALSSLVTAGDKWLDIGCGRQILPAWVMNQERQRALASKASLLVGMDVDEAILKHPLLDARVIGKGEKLPFACETFDLLTANMVFEHVEEPAQVLREVCRVLKPGGRLLFHTPNYHYYLIALASLIPDSVKRRVIRFLEDREEKDIFPTLYRLNTMGRIRQVAGQCGLEVESIRAHVSAGEFYVLGPVAWAECLWLKLMSVVGRGTFDAGLVVTLRRPGIPSRREMPEMAAEGLPVS